MMPDGYTVQDICRFHDRIAALEAKVERLRLSHRHCAQCGGSWLDDGLTVGCSCHAIKRLKAEIERLKLLLGHALSYCPASYREPIAEILRRKAAKEDIAMKSDSTCPTGHAPKQPTMQERLAAAEKFLKGSRQDADELRDQLEVRDGQLDSAEKLEAELRAEVERLRSTVSRLPKTADGVPVVLGMDVWNSTPSGCFQFRVRETATQRKHRGI